MNSREETVKETLETFPQPWKDIISSFLKDDASDVGERRRTSRLRGRSDKRWRLRRRRLRLNCLQMALRSMPHSKVEFRRLLHFLARYVPSTENDSAYLLTPRLLTLSSRRLRVRLVSFLALASALLFHGRGEREKSLRPLARRIEPFVDESTPRCFALFLLRHAARSRHSSPSSSPPAGSSPSPFFRGSRHEKEIDNLLKRFGNSATEAPPFLEPRNVADSVETGKSFFASTEETMDGSEDDDDDENGKQRDVLETRRVVEPVAFECWRSTLDVVGFRGGENDAPLDFRGDDDDDNDDSKNNDVVEALRCWLEDDGRGRAAAASSSSAIAPTTQNPVVKELDANLFLNLSGGELLIVLRSAFENEEYRDLPMRSIAQFTEALIAWYRRRDSDDGKNLVDDVGDSRRSIFNLVSSTILIPRLTSLDAAPPRAVIAAIGELLLSNSSSAVDGFFFPFILSIKATYEASESKKDVGREAMAQTVSDEKLSKTNSFALSHLGQFVRLYSTLEQMDELLRGTLEKLEGSLIGNSLLFTIVEATIDRLASSSSAASSSPLYLSSPSVHLFLRRFVADLRSHPREKSIVVLLEKFLHVANGAGVVGGTDTTPAILFTKKDTEELATALMANRTPLKKRVLATLKMIISVTDNK